MESFYAFLEEFETELTCSICEKTFTDPVTLPCLHSFCSTCMEQLCKKTNNTSVSCPYPACRSPFDVPDGGVSKLCSSFYLKALLKLIHVIGTKAKWEEQEMQCINCERTTNLVAFCQQCNGLTCTECNSAHNILKSSRNHKVTMVNEINRDSVEDFIKNLVVCEEPSHENNKLNYYCFEESCKKYICLKCVAEDHVKFHDFSSVYDAADKVKQNIKECMTRVDNLKQRYEEELSLSQQNISRIRSEVEQAKKEVHDAVEAVIQKARQHEEAICKALDEILSKQQDANDGEQSDINTGINHLSEFNVHCQSLIDRNSKYEVIDVQDILMDKCEVALQRSTILSSKPIERNSILRYDVAQVPEVENMGEIVQTLPNPSHCTIRSLREVRCGFENQFEIVTRKAEGDLCDTSIGSIYVEVKDPDGNRIQAQLSMKEKGRFTVRYKAEKVGVCKVKVTIGGEQIKNSPRNVNTYETKRDFMCARTFNPVNENKEPALKYPLSIAVNENGEIAIADRQVDVIHMFDAEGGFIRKIKVKPDGEQFAPEGVLFVEDKLIVTGMSAGKGEIVEIDLTDEKVRTIYRPDEGFVPRGMCVTDENNIAVCYNGDEKHGINSGIKLFDEEGIFLSKFQSPEKNCIPWCVAYGNGKYFVSYFSESCRVFDSNGVFLRTFGVKGQDGGQFHKVAGLTLYGPDLILVCDPCNNRVQLLTQEGKFVTSFSTIMSIPIDLVVTPDGQVFVLNFGSKQVQLWR